MSSVEAVGETYSCTDIRKFSMPIETVSAQDSTGTGTMEKAWVDFAEVPSMGGSVYQSSLIGWQRTGHLVKLSFRLTALEPYVAWRAICQIVAPARISDSTGTMPVSVFVCVGMGVDYPETE